MREPVVGVREIRYASRELDRLVSTLKDEPGEAATLVILSGASTDQKSVTAEAIATQLDRALVRVDLSAIVSKYIGETEKNLDRLFDDATRSGAVLLFDEADALFGNRSAVRPSGDRFASVETNDLLQRLDAFSGIVVLVVNDPKPAREQAAKLRRARTVVVLDR
jgi:SpoVK/Ycf46/Vps4 family AAA+-type ATPase